MVLPKSHEHCGVMKYHVSKDTFSSSEKIKQKQEEKRKKTPKTSCNLEVAIKDRREPYRVLQARDNI